MKDVTPVRGAKKDKNAPRKPVIMKDSASSTSIAKIQYGFSEGTIWGLVDGAKSVILGGTPLEAIDGTKNFKNVTYDIRLGTNDQTYMKGFPDVSNEVGIGVELKGSAPYVRAINDTQLSAVRVRLRWNGLSSTNSENGDVSGHRIDYAIDLQTDGGAYAEVLNTNISDKVSTGYERTHRIELPRATQGWQIRIRRLTANSTSEFIRDTMYVDAIAEVIDAKFNYPNTAHMGIEFDSEIFRGIPKLEAHVRGLIIRVPTNYDPVSRTYIGMWDGLFKEAYTNNPAWIYYDIVTAKRYGLGDRINPSMVDKWTVYALGVYCDQLVPDGLGGQEPRFTCNVYLQKTSDAYQVLSSLSGVFRAMAFWNGERVVLDADMPKDPVYTFSRANVIADENGMCFNHTGSRFRDRHTIVKVAWDNPANAFQTEYEYIRDEKAISKYGIRVLDLSAFACTSQGQAQRAGLWALQTEQLETRQITFSVGLDGFLPQVADVVNVADELFAGRANSGRVSAISAGQFVVTLDRDITVNAGDVLIINGSDGKAERRVVKSAAGRKVTMVVAFTKAEQQNIWALETADLKLMRFRIMSIQENSDSSFNITALQHEPKKFSAIDFGADVIPDNITSITPDVIEAPSKVTVTTRHRVVQGQTITTLVIDWSQVKEAVGYDVEWRKDDGNWIKVPRTGNTSVEVEGVYAGRYTAQVRSISAYDVASPSAFSPITEVKGKVGLPPNIVGLTVTGILFGFDLNWSFGAGSGDAAFTEIQVATAPNVNVKQLGLYAYNTNKLQLNGLMGNLSQSFRARLVDKLGFTSAWGAWVTGTTSASAAPIMDMIQGQINESSLNQALTSKIGKIDANSSSISGINTELNKAKADIIAVDGIIAANKLEATNAVAAANAELATAKTDISTAKTDIVEAKRIADLAKTDSAANKINIVSLTTTVGNNKTSVDSSITTLTDKDLALSNLYTALKSEYDGNKASVSQDLTALTNKDISLSSLLTVLDTDYQGNKTAIRNELTAVSTKTDSTANSLTSLTTEVGNNKTAITTEATTRSTEDTALSNRITTVSGKTDNALSRITTAETTIASNTGAITQQKTDITAAYKKAIDDIEIGGRNLVLDTATMRTELGTWDSANITNSDGILTLVSNGSEQWKGSPSIEVKAGVSYTASIRAKADNLDIGLSMPLYYDNFWHSPYKTYAKDTSGEWITISETFVPVMDSIMRIAIHNHKNTTGIAYYKQVKVEKGNKATDWTPAPEDVEASITAAITTESTARTSAVEAVAKTVTALDTRFEGNKTSVTNALTVLTNKDTSLANSITALTTTVGNNTTAISTESTARSTADTAIGNRITTVEGKTDNALSRVSTVETIAADNKSSIASTNTQVTAAFKAIDDIEVTGRNLFRVDKVGRYLGIDIYPKYDNIVVEGNTIKVLSNPIDIIGAPISNFKGDTLTISGKTNLSNIQSYYRFNTQNSNTSLSVTVINGKFTFSINIPTGVTSLNLGLGIYPFNTPYQISEVKVESGLIATEWTVAPEDALDFGTGNKAAITSEATARANEDGALSTRINTVKATADNAQARVGTVETAITTATNSIASNKSEVEAKFNNLPNKNLIDNGTFAVGQSLTPWSINSANRFVGEVSYDGSNNAIRIVANQAETYMLASYSLFKEIGYHTLSFWIKGNKGGSLNVQMQDRVHTTAVPVTTVWTKHTISADITARGGHNYSVVFGGWGSWADIALEVFLSNIELTKDSAAINNVAARVGTVESAVATNTGAIASTRTDVTAILDKGIEGRNLLRHGTFPTQSIFNNSHWECNCITKDAAYDDVFGSTSAIRLAVNHSNSYLLTLEKLFETTGLHTVSFWVKGNYNGRINVSLGAQDVSNYVPVSTTWTKQTVTANISNIDGYHKLVFGGWSSWTDTGLQVYLSHIKVEKGNTATAWTAAPTDASASVSIEATATANKVTGLEAQYTVKLDVGGRVSGFGLASSATQSDFAINADRFYIAPPTGSAKGTSPFMVLTAPQTINGASVPAGTYMRSAYIHDGSIDVAKINKASINNLSAISANIGHFKSAPTGARLEIQDSVLTVYDANNRLRVRLGLW